MAENFPNFGKEMHIQIQETQRTPKQEYTETYYNQIVKSLGQRENFDSLQRTATYHIWRNSHKIIWISQQKSCRSEESRMIYLKYLKENTANQEYSKTTI